MIVVPAVRLLPGKKDAFAIEGNIWVTNHAAGIID
jgi:hypothetical protein